MVIIFSYFFYAAITQILIVSAIE